MTTTSTKVNNNSKTKLRRKMRRVKEVTSFRRLLQNCLSPLLKSEQPYLARLQERWCSPWLDPFFVYSTYLGTHKFFLITLPALFWFGHFDLARGLVVVLALGVYLTGFLKDTACLPRPDWPTIRRPELLNFTRQQHSMLQEYGFPSTHATNAITIALFICSHFAVFSADVNWSWLLALGFYVWNISFGRIYCGMHGLVDVISGLLLGTSVWVFWLFGWTRFEAWFLNAGWEAPLIGAILVIALIVIHPQPLHPCPCFQDSVAFIAACLGVLIGSWQQRIPIITNPWESPIRSFLLILFGVACVMGWRKVAKYTLQNALYNWEKTFTKRSIDLAIQLVVYTGIGWLAAEGVMSLAIPLGLIKQ